jgi:N-acetylglutamate synthase-like GNAT family acetyltransferase
VTKTGPIIRPVANGDYPAIAALLDRVLGKRPYERRLDLWKWRYDRNPARTDAFPSFLVVEEKNRIVGVHGLIPLRVKTGTRQLFASCSCDLAVDPAARSAGMKLKLAALAKELSPLHLSTSANEPANKITLALGGREVSSGRRKWILPLKASGLMRRKLADRGWGSEIVAGASMAIWKPADWILAVVRSAKSPNRVAGGKIKDVASFDARFDKLWEDLAEEQAILVVRDSSYLNWRYSDSPFAGIQSFELSRGDHLLGFSVIHLAVDEDRLRFAAILELAGPRGENVVTEHLLGEAIRRAVAAGAHYVIVRASTSEEEDSFRRLGFRAREMRYSPVTYKNNSDVPKELFEKDRNWYLTLGDGDGCYYLDPEF